MFYGEWLRRHRRRIDARLHLRAAPEIFQQLGQQPWEVRARSELRASGETARKRDPSTRDELTPQELQISRLVAAGRATLRLPRSCSSARARSTTACAESSANSKSPARADLADVDLGKPVAA